MSPDPKTSEVFARIVSDLIRIPGVEFPEPSSQKRRSFGSHALKINSKVFSMLDSRGQFVVKLPRERVLELLDDGRGAPFEMGKARWIKEWVVLVQGTEAEWAGFAREALEFVRNNSSAPL